MPTNLLILGATARAAAWSAHRAGFTVWAADLFADSDLQEIGTAVRIGTYPDELATVAQGMPPGPWMYTGGLENYPSLVDRIAASRPLWGNAGAALRAIRNPHQFARVFREAGLAHPAVRFDGEKISRDGSWLRKPWNSCGGFRIHRVSSVDRHATPPGRWYYQRYVEGPSYSAVYVAAAGEARLLGVTRQLSGASWTGADPFRYHGSIGPLRLEPRSFTAWRHIGQCLARRFPVCGLFGVDAIVSHGEVWPVEVNPRYTASMEVVERGTGVSAIGLHAQCATEGRLPPWPPESITDCHGKAIVYAQGDVRVSERMVTALRAMRTDRGEPSVADVPRAGESIAHGRPVATALAQAGDARQVEQRLKDTQMRIRALLAWHRIP